jgi:hypothetical protein
VKWKSASILERETEGKRCQNERVCVCVCVCLCNCLCVCVSVCVYVCVYMSVCVYVCVLCVSVCVSVCMSVCVCLCVCVRAQSLLCCLSTAAAPHQTATKHCPLQQRHTRQPQNTVHCSSATPDSHKTLSSCTPLNTHCVANSCR